MARKKIREFHAKRMLFRALGIEWKAVLIGPEDNLEDVAKKNPWVLEEKLVAKPDQLFGKRGKHGLVYVNKTWEEVKEWIREKRGKEVEIGKAKDVLTHFIVEPFFPHQKEYYVAIRSVRDGEELLFSEHGGIDVEEHWDKVKVFPIKHGGDFTEEIGEGLEAFISKLLSFFREMDFTYLEINPLAFDGKNYVPLDTVAELDGYAEFKNRKIWEVEFPSPFGKRSSEHEKKVEVLDEKSTASMKLTILNPRGRIWLLVAGGGASVIYADTVVDMGLKEELANYAEYSGNPTEEETYEYAKVLLDAMLSNNMEGKFLLIGGGVANFTDVEKTFSGIMRAIEERAREMREQKVKVLVRRGGPNSEAGLAKIKKACERLNIPIEVYKEDVPLTHIVKVAVEEVKKNVQ